MKDEITILENGNKKRERKYNQIYTKLPVSDKLKFPKFCDLSLKNVLLLKQSIANQYKCIIHENFCR